MNFERKLKNLRQFSVESDTLEDEEVISTGFKMIEDSQPLWPESRRGFQQKFSGIIRDLEEVHRRRNGPRLFASINSYSPSKVERINRGLIKPKSNLIGARKTYDVSTRINEDRGPSKWKEIGEEMMLVRNSKKFVLFESANEPDEEFYKAIEKDCSKTFYEYKVNCSALESGKTYFLKEVSPVRVRNSNNRNGDLLRFQRAMKKVHFDDIVIEIGGRKRDNLVKKFKNKVKHWLHM